MFGSGMTFQKLQKKKKKSKLVSKKTLKYFLKKGFVFFAVLYHCFVLITIVGVRLVEDRINDASQTQKTSDNPVQKSIFK